MSKPVHLAQVNYHPMDDRISFEESTHVYTIDGESDYTSVTTFVHQQFPHFDSKKVIDSLLSPTNIFRGKTYPNKNKYRTNAFETVKHENIQLSDEQINDLLNDTNSEIYKREAKKISDEWLQTSTSGTKTHADIEYFYNKIPIENDTKEYEYFQEFNRDFQAEFPNYRPYRTEWTVFYKELKLAGSIDMIYENIDDGTLMIYDWKRVKEIKYESFNNEIATNPILGDMPNVNFWHYSLQLNTYKGILEAQYGKTVTAIRLVRLYPEAPTYDIHECRDLQREVLTLFDNRKKTI